MQAAIFTKIRRLRENTWLELICPMLQHGSFTEVVGERGAKTKSPTNPSCTTPECTTVRMHYRSPSARTRSGTTSTSLCLPINAISCALKWTPPHCASFIHSNFTLIPVVANTYSNSLNSSLPHIGSPLGSHERTFPVRPSNATWQFLGPKHFAIP